MNSNNIYSRIILIFILAKLIMLYAYSNINTETSFVNNVMHADSWWFSNIINYGYMSDVIRDDPIRMNQANWAFFPLYPLICKLIILIFGIRTEFAEIIVNQVELMICLFICYKMVLTYLPPNNALILPIAIAFSPANIWFISAYSDMTYLLFTVLIFYSYHQQKYWNAAIFGYFLALSRFVGVIIIFAHLISYMRNKTINNRNIIELSLQLLLIIAGLLSFMIYLHLKCGDAFAFYHIQKAWGHLGTDWLHHPIISFVDTWHSGVDHDRFFLLISPLFLFILLLNRRFEEFIFALFCLLTPLLAGSLWSFSRYCLGIYPVYLSISLLHRRYQILALGVLFLFVFISASYYNDWFNDRWV